MSELPTMAETLRWRVIRELESGVFPSRARLVQVAGMIEEAARGCRRLVRHRELIRDLHRCAIGASICQRAAAALRGLWGLS